MKNFMIWLVRLYRKCISPLKPPCCRFTPTCSQYAIEAFSKRGFFVGFILTAWRILRCNPFCKGGYDPVPDKGFRNPKGISPQKDIPEDDKSCNGSNENSQNRKSDATSEQSTSHTSELKQ